MKAAYAVAFAAVGICLLFCIAKAKKNDRRIAVVVRKLLSVGFAAVLANIVIVLTSDKNVCMVAYSVFFACIDWLLYFMFCFALEFCGSADRKYVIRPLWWVILTFDSLSMLGNIFLHHAFDCKPIVTEYEEVYFRPVGYGFYGVHLTISYLLVVFTFAILIHKAIVTSEIYREKYLLVLVILGFIVIGDATYVFTDEKVNVSIVSFALGGMMIYYYAVVFVPKELMKRTLTLVVQDMSDAVFILDEDGKCIHVNESARNFLKEEKSNYKDVENEFQKWSVRNNILEKTDFSFPITRNRENSKVYLKVFFHNLLDEKNNYLGCFFTVQDWTEEAGNLEKERYAANHDELTGLYNKKCFYKRVTKQLEADPEGEYLLACSDIRNFKLVNDVFGDEKGDELLIKIADTLRARNTEGEVYGRLENDRFGLLMKKQNFREQTFLPDNQSVIYIDGNYTYPIKVCVGIYEIGNKAVPVSVMCDRAFMAIATIKDNYEKNLAYYDDTLRNNVLREQKLIGELTEALTSGQFKIFLQPQMDAEGKVLGAEALVRWQHPERGMISPGEFIGVFEKNGTITKLDRHIWELACAQLKKWKDRGREDLYISVNISPKDFYFMDLYKTFCGLVEQYGICAAKLKLEITETSVMSDLEKQLKLISKLRNAGFIVEMDDFGSGYSSLNMLKEIKVDVLKIDMAFLGKTEDEERARKILKMVVELSKQLQVPVITEGVETSEQVEFLKNIGCEIFQGYYFAKPMEINAFEEKYM